MAGAAEFIASRAEAESTQSKVDSTIRGLKAKELSLKCERWRFKLGVQKGQWILKADVAAAIRRILGRVASNTESKLVHQWPLAVSGLDTAQARVFGRKLYDELMADYQKLATEFPE